MKILVNNNVLYNIYGSKSEHTYMSLVTSHSWLVCCIRNISGWVGMLGGANGHLKYWYLYNIGTVHGKKVLRWFYFGYSNEFLMENHDFCNKRIMFLFFTISKINDGNAVCYGR